MINRKSWVGILIFSVSIITIAILFYVIWFSGILKRGISDSPEQWGQFGDYMGGLLNPVLSFISICILVKTAFYQDDMSKRQEEREDRKRFEDRFYGMVSYQRQAFNDFYLKFGDRKTIYKGEAVRFIEDLLFNEKDFLLLDDAFVKNSVFSAVRQFYLVVKLIDDEVVEGKGFKNGDKNFYYKSLINLTDFDLIRIVLFGCVLYNSWSNAKYIMANEDFLSEIKNVGLGAYIEKVKVVKEGK